MDDRPKLKAFRATCDSLIARGTVLSRLIVAQWSELPAGSRWIWGGLNFIAVLVMARRLLAGPTPSSVTGVVVIGSLIAAACLFARHLSEPASERLLDDRLKWWTIALSAGPMLILIFSTRTSAFGMGCLLALSGYTLIGGWHWSQTSDPLWFESVRDPLPQLTDPAWEIPLESEVEEPLLTSKENLDGSPQQWLARSAPGPGEDFLEGTLRSEFVPGQKLLFLHVPFSPPFLAVPELECEVQAEGEVRLKVAAVYRYGARIELRRSGPLTEIEPVELHIAASVKYSADAA